MKDTRPIEEQVAELTEKEKDKIVIADLIIGIVLVIALLPIISIMIICTLLIPNPAFYHMADGLLITSFILMVVGLLLCLLAFVILKLVCPYYSNKKCKYIKKMRKEQKKQG